MTDTTSGPASSDEHWAALNKNTFLNILNEILHQSAITTPDMTSRAPARKKSPTYDHVTVSRRASPMNCDTLFLDNHVTSGFTSHDRYTLSPFAGCQWSTGCDQVDATAAISEWNSVIAKSQSTCSLPYRHSSLRRGDPALETATDLTTVDRRHSPLYHSAELFSSMSCSSRRRSEETVDVCSLETSKLPESVKDVRFQSSSSSLVGDVRKTTKDLDVSDLAACVDELRENVEQQRCSTKSVTSSPKCLNAAPSTGITSQSTDYHSAANNRRCNYGKKSDVGPRVSWMPIDKSLLCDVVDQILRRDKTFGFRDHHNATFPFPVDKYFTGSNSDNRCCSPEVMPATMRQRFPGDDFMLRRLLSPSCPEMEPEMPERSLHGHRVRKRSTSADTHFSSEKRRCADSDCQNVPPFPVYVDTRNDDIECSEDDDNKTRRNMSLSPSLKWKSTMLLRMRSETATAQ